MFNIIKIVKEKKFNDETISLIKEMGLLDENEEQKKKSSCNKIIVTIILLLFLSIASIWCYEIFKSSSSSQGIISANLVCEKGSYNPAFLGFEFTAELEAAIKSGKIDLYGIYICHTTDVVFLKESSEAIAGTVDKLRIVKKEYIEYSENYINTYFSKEAADKMREEGDIGYWKYTIDIVD